MAPPPAVPREDVAILPYNPELAGPLVDEPADLNRRLVYADWLEEQGAGGPARLIRTQCQLTTLDPWDDRAVAVRAEATYLTRVLGEQLVRAAVERVGLEYTRYRQNWLFDLHISRGLPDDLRVEFPAGLHYLAALASALPIVRVAVKCQATWSIDQQREALAGLRLFKLTALRCYFSGLGYGEIFEQLGSLPHIAGVRALSSGWAPGRGYAAAAKGLLESRRWDEVDVPVALDPARVAELEPIRLRSRHLRLVLADEPGPVRRLLDRWGDGLEAVTYQSVGNRWLRGLTSPYPDGHTIRSLAFDGCVLAPESARELLPPDLFRDLISLSIDDCVGAKGLVGDGAKTPSRLRTLRIGSGDLTGAAIARLLSAPHPELAVLDLAGSPMTTTCVKALARNKVVTGQLASLSLRGTDVDSGCLGVLSEVVWPRLVELDLGAAAPQRGLAGLLDPDRYPSLLSVTVKSEDDLAGVAAELRRGASRSGVRYLGLDCPVSQRGVEAVLDMLPASQLEYVLVNPGSLAPEARADATDRSWGRLRFR